MGKIIPLFPEEEEKEKNIVPDEAVLRLLNVMYNGEVEEQKPQRVTTDKDLKNLDFCINKLRALNGSENNQEIKSYVERINARIDKFIYYMKKLNESFYPPGYKGYRRDIYNIIIEFAVSFCESYNFSCVYDSDKIIIEGITIKYFENDDFSLDYMYNTLVNIALFYDDYGRDR